MAKKIVRKIARKGAIYIGGEFRYRINQNDDSFDIIVCSDGEFKSFGGYADVGDYLKAYGYKIVVGNEVTVTEFGRGCYRIKADTDNPKPLREFNAEWFNLDPPCYEIGREIKDYDISLVPKNASVKYYRSEGFEALVIGPYDNALLGYSHFEKRYGSKLSHMAYPSCEFTYDGRLPITAADCKHFKCYGTPTGDAVLLREDVNPNRVFASFPDVNKDYEVRALKDLVETSVKKYVALKKYCESVEAENRQLRSMLEENGG